MEENFSLAQVSEIKRAACPWERGPMPGCRGPPCESASACGKVESSLGPELDRLSSNLDFSQFIERSQPNAFHSLILSFSHMYQLDLLRSTFVGDGSLDCSVNGSMGQGLEVCSAGEEGLASSAVQSLSLWLASMS